MALSWKSPRRYQIRRHAQHAVGILPEVRPSLQDGLRQAPHYRRSRPRNDQTNHYQRIPQVPKQMVSRGELADEFFFVYRQGRPMEANPYDAIANFQRDEAERGHPDNGGGCQYNDCKTDRRRKRR